MNTHTLDTTVSTPYPTLSLFVCMSQCAQGLPLKVANTPDCTRRLQRASRHTGPAANLPAGGWVAWVDGWWLGGSLDQQLGGCPANHSGGGLWVQGHQLHLQVGVSFDWPGGWVCGWLDECWGGCWMSSWVSIPVGWECGWLDELLSVYTRWLGVRVAGC